MVNALYHRKLGVCIVAVTIRSWACLRTLPPASPLLTY
jgi:hypothetical protein